MAWFWKRGSMSCTSEDKDRYGGNACADAMREMTRGVEVGALAAFWWLSAFKYLWRWPRKGRRRDLEKCVDCVHRLWQMVE